MYAINEFPNKPLTDNKASLEYKPDSHSLSPEYADSPLAAEILKHMYVSPDCKLYGPKKPFTILLQAYQKQENFYKTFLFSQHSYQSWQLDDQAVAFLHSRPQHQHSCIEIMCVLSGTVTNHVENQVFTYEAGQCCIMNKNIRHSEEFSGDFQAIFLMLQDDFIAELLSENHEINTHQTIPPEENLIFQFFIDNQNEEHQFDKVYLDCFPLVSTDEITEKLSPLFNFIVQETANLTPGSIFLIKGAFSRILQLIADPTLFSVNRIHSRLENQEYLFSKITHMMQSSFGRCTREELSSQLHYNGDYLNRIMKKYTGMTILEYGQSIYLEETRRLLSDTDQNISSIIEAFGFSNRSHFYRLFQKKYGETPLNYRKHHR